MRDVTFQELDIQLAEQLPARELMTSSNCGCNGGGGDSGGNYNGNNGSFNGALNGNHVTVEVGRPPVL